MAGRGTTEYVIRLPDRLWQALIDTGYIIGTTGPATFAVFEAAQQARSGPGHARFIRGDKPTLLRILTQLLQLVSDIRSGTTSGRPFIIAPSDIERWAHQNPKPAAEVRILGKPDDLDNGE